MGPWRAAQRFIREINVDAVASVRVELYGSLAKTGKGHGTDLAVQLGLNGDDPVTIPVDAVSTTIKHIKNTKTIRLAGRRDLPFDPDLDVVFIMDQALPYHANGLIFRAFYQNGEGVSQTYFSVGGGFVVKEGEEDLASSTHLPFPIDRASELRQWCTEQGASISEIVLRNELSWRSEAQVRTELMAIWEVMRQCIYKGSHTDGVLPGGLDVGRRAAPLSRKLLDNKPYHNVDDWITKISRGGNTFQDILKWVSCFALAVNGARLVGLVQALCLQSCSSQP